MKIKPGCAGCFAGLSCGIRVEIINLLHYKGKMSVGQIATCFAVTQPTISHHLSYMKKAGMLASEKKGKQIFYFVNPKCPQCGIF
jgi:DNA-binding transcriptional ArsR family regulator